MKIVDPLLLVCSIFCCQICKSFAQTEATDSSSRQHSFNYAVSVLNSSLGNEARLYNGPEYYFYDPLIKGNAYFLDVNAFAPGSVYYDGVQFLGVPMLYDLYKDEVVVVLYNHFSKFSLLRSKLTSFEFLGHRFINIDADTLTSNQVLKSGIYDQLYSGKVQLLAKRSKDIQVNSSSTLGPESYFNTRKVEYFLRVKSKFYAFSSQNNLLDLLKDHKMQVQRFIRSGNLKYRKNPEEVMVKIITYYDQLN